MKAIAAMSLNRVIGRGNQIPWHLPEDFKWFKQCTSGGTVVMGRKTWVSLGRPLPNRTNVVITRGPAIPGVTCLSDLETLDERNFPGEIWIIGGEEIYRQLLPKCSDLFLSVVTREIPDGDAFFPEFEDQFEQVNIPLKTADFEVRHYRKRSVD